MRRNLRASSTRREQFRGCVRGENVDEVFVSRRIALSCSIR